MIKQSLSKKFIQLTVSAICLLGVSFAHADIALVKKSLAEKLPNVDTSQIDTTPVKDVYSVDLGERFAYVTGDGKHLFVGELIDMETGVNYSQLALGKKRVATIKSIPEENYIVFPAKNKKHSITVFTDIDCGYCRKLHNEIDELNESGIEVRYLLRPRAGPKSVSWQKADSVYCSKNQQKNLTRSKQGIDIKMQSCGETPTMENVATSQYLGFNGTPAVLSENGSYMGGYVEAKELLKKLDAEKALSGS